MEKTIYSKPVLSVLGIESQSIMAASGSASEPSTPSTPSSPSVGPGKTDEQNARRVSGGFTDGMVFTNY